MKKLTSACVRLLWCVGAVVSAPWAAAQPRSDQAGGPVFDVLEYVVEGSAALSPAVVGQVLEPYLGPGRRFADLEAARQALEKAYQDAGFLSIVVSLPNQRVDAGEVRLEVTEARVEQLRVTGAKHHLPSRVKEAVPGLAPGALPYFPQVQDELAALQTPHRQVTPVIGAGSEPDRIDVELKVEDKRPVQAALELNSRQGFNTERGRLETTASYGNLFQRGHTLGLSWQVAPTRPSDANTLSVLYDLPLTPRDGLTLSVTNSAADTPTGTSVGGATITRGTFYSLRWRHELPAWQWPVVHSWSVGLDRKLNRDRSVTGSGFTTQRPALKYPVFNLGYDLAWDHGEATLSTLRTSVAGSSRSWAGREVNCEGRILDQFECKRSGASPDFLVWRFGMTHRRPLGAGWQFDLSADAQLASGPLASGEQFGLGGMDSIRGYYDYEQVGDQGWSLRLEAQTPAWWQHGDWRLSALGFVDRGSVLLKQALEGQLARVNLGSYGLGWRMRHGDGLTASLDVAMPVYATRRAAADGGFDAATRRTPRWEFSVRQAF